MAVRLSLYFPLACCRHLVASFSWYMRSSLERRGAAELAVTSGAPRPRAARTSSFCFRCVLVPDLSSCKGGTTEGQTDRQTDRQRDRQI